MIIVEFKRLVEFESTLNSQVLEYYDCKYPIARMETEVTCIIGSISLQ